VRSLATIAWHVTEHPSLVPRLPNLSDDEVLHTVALSAYFGHLNRIADAVGVPLDYPVKHTPSHAEPAVPALVGVNANVTKTKKPTITIEQRPATAEKLADWAAYVFDRDTEALARERRVRIRRHVELLLGAHEATVVGDDLERDLLALTDIVTLAPWKIDDATYAPLRARGFDDAALFDACVVATTAGVTARITVALAALAR
jgi:alkylhydroperoxidase family enzyme